jgi:hypothetical protein
MGAGLLSVCDLLLLLLALGLGRDLAQPLLLLQFLFVLLKNQHLLQSTPW